MILFSQRDPRWGNIHIGNTVYTIHQKGCAITCIAAISTYIGASTTPADIAQHWTKFDEDPKSPSYGGIFWNTLAIPAEPGEQLGALIRDRSYNPTRIQAALANPNQFVMLNVSNGGHWLWVLKRLWGDTYWCMDPWFGDKCFASLKGGRYNNIVGSMTFLRK
jgi:hypothetical protein